MRHKAFGVTGQKFPKIWYTVQENKDETEKLDPINVIEVPYTTLKKTSRFPLDTTPNYYNLYDYTGVTYISGGSNQNIPNSSLYTENPTGTWNFNLPIYNYRVPVGTTPQEQSGSDEWELASSIGNIKAVVKFESLPERDIYSFDLLSYLYDEEGNVVESENFSQFYRWVKTGAGYDFYYHAFWTIPEDKEILLKAELVLLNKKNYGVIQYTKVQD